MVTELGYQHSSAFGVQQLCPGAEHMLIINGALQTCMSLNNIHMKTYMHSIQQTKFDLITFPVSVQTMHSNALSLMSSLNFLK